MVTNHGVASTDSMLLSWGSSVNVCEDSRRAIRQEMDRIDADISNLHGKINSEDRVSSQVIKDLAHAQAEMANYRRGAADVKDSALMNDQLRGRLMESLRSDIMNPLRKPTTNCTTENGEENSFIQQPPNVKAFIEQRDSDKIELIQSAVNRRAEVHAIKSKTHTLVDDIKRINMVIEQDNLVAGCDISSKEMSDQTVAVEGDKRRMRAIKVAVHEARTKCGIHAQEIADRTKMLTAMKSKNAMDELVLAKELADIESDLREQDELMALQSRFENVNQQVEILLKSVADFHLLDEARSNKKRQHTCWLAELAEGQRTFEIQQNDVAEATTFAIAAAKELEQGNAVKNKVDALRRENDQAEKHYEETGRQEQDELTKEKENIAAVIKALDHEARATVLALEKELLDQDECYSAIAKDAKHCEMVMEEKCTTLENLRKISKEYGDATALELSELNTLVTSLKEAETAELERFSELKDSLKTDREKALSDKHTESMSLREACIQKLENLRCGREMLDEALSAEKALEVAH